MGNQKEVIIITGCSGRIGFRAAERLIGKYQIVGFDVFLAANLPDIEFVIVDVGTDESVREGLEYVRKKYGNKISSVIHLAAYYSFSGGSYANYERITVKGTQRLLNGLQSFEVEQFIFSSTMLVHAPCQPGERINENSPVIPSWAYPKSKVETEAVMHADRGNIPIVILRIAGVYDNRCHSIPISNQIQRIYENQFEGHVFSGDVTHGASFLHMDDLVDALWLTVEKRRQLPNEVVLLLGEEETLSYNTLQTEIARLIHDKEWKTWSIPKPIAKIGAWMLDHLPFFKESFIKPWMIDIADDHYALDITRARNILGWEPKRALRKTLPLMISELKTDPVAWYEENKLNPNVIQKSAAKRD